MKNLLLFFVLHFTYLQSQTTSIEFLNKDKVTIKLEAYTSLNSANKTNPDSVFGLDLTSQGLLDFPKQILKFKNLKYLNISSYNWSEVLDSLTETQKNLYFQLKQNACEGCGVMRFYKPSTVTNIPKKIKKLNRLEYVNFGEGVSIKNLKKFKKIYKYLPNCLIYPNIYDLIEN